MSELMTIFLIALLGYALGRISIKGLSLGTSGILIVALVCGHFGMEVPKIIQNIGLVVFVGSVGFIAGPRFFGNFKKKATSFIILGITIILLGALTCAAVSILSGIDLPLALGMMSGALTSTPGLAAAIEATGSDLASIGYGIAYPFGVVGVVLFVQLMPRFLHVDLDAEREKAAAILAAEDAESNEGKAEPKNLLEVDEFGLFALSAAIIVGLLIAKINIPLPGGAQFSLGTSGGPLLAGLVFGHFGHFGPISVKVPTETLNTVREIGLGLFLMGAGTNAGKGFVAILAEHGVMLFFFGACMTLVPMLAGYLIANKIFKIDILNTLGAICGGMTSTPALGTLITMTRSEAVAISYAATYPIALIMVVLCCQFLPIIMR
ncbi:MAG: permease [Lachnospiraceae bacterium]|nr:permease [Lachnospiraceae bacterium]